MDDRVGSYQRSRRRFAGLVYLLTFFWLLLALAQWLLTSVVYNIGYPFNRYEWISVIFFTLSIVLVLIFIFFEQVRFVVGLNIVLAIIIVEFAIIGIFALSVKTLWPELLIWFFTCVFMLFVFILLGSLIPHDLTLDVVILFVISFVFLIMAIFLIILHMVTHSLHTYILFQIFINIIVLTFVMYHAQTINGGRFAEMRVNDYLLASIILFFDFTVMFLLTFYMQIHFKVATYDLHSKHLSTTKQP